MTEKTNSEWVPDLDTMTCRNVTNNIVVVFAKEGKSLRAKIKDVPMDLFAKWADDPHGEKYVEKAVSEAEEVFLKAYFESKIEEIK